ncbi:portal protein [Microbulbifer sp. 2201CG32-9]|uniref:portal protein n=1 Tax=Microbulbifer sp. 2201CG32-9 TaxID=3232309 RepID=UPI00345C55AC
MATAKARWEKLNGSRDAILQRARDAADLTIPALLPPEGHNENSTLPQPYQSLGARGVNNLASKLAMALLPTGNPFFRMMIPDDVLAEIADDTEIQEELRKIENRAMRLVERGNLRVALHATLRNLITTGNALLHMPATGGARMFRLTNFCVLRDAMGYWREIVIKESVHPATLDQALIGKMDIEVDLTSDDNLEVYTYIRKESDKAVWDQQIEDKVVPGSDGRTSYDECPYIPLRWGAIENEDYGRGHVEEYMGDLRSLEGLSKSIVQFAAAAAKIIFLEKPNSTTDLEALNRAESGEFVEGNRDDIETLQVEKFPDFQVAKSTADDLTLRLSHAFLLTTGTVRNAERVTAEEIRMQAQELEDVLGGVYTVLSQELQLPIVKRLMAQMRKAQQMPTLPDAALEPVVITGFDALGRGHELNKYREYFADGKELFGEGFMAQFDHTKVAQLMATHHNIDIEDIQKSPQQMEREEDDAVVGSVVDKAAGPVAGQLAGALASSMTEEIPNG